jgi:hypothetical protein
MSAAPAARVRHQAPHAGGAPVRSTARLLGVELRRNVMPWVLPLVAALFWLDAYRSGVGAAPLYGMRTYWSMGEGHAINDFAPFTAGVAAWTGSRDGRRGLTDLVTTASRPRWTAQLATWGATAIWAVAAYLAFVGVMFAWYARQGVGGAPPWWWVADGATAVLALSAAGFVIGTYWPSRFAAAAAAFGGILAMFLAAQIGLKQSGGWALILPTNYNNNYAGNPQADAGIFYPWLPDLPLARIMFLAGIAVALVGLTGLPARAGGRWLRRAAAIGSLCGVALTGAAVQLAGGAQAANEGIIISALHDSANDQPIAYAPVCGRAAGVPVCLNPAYGRWRPDVTTALTPVFAEVAGLPGAPARADQVAATYVSNPSGPPLILSLGGRPPVLSMALGQLNMPGPCGFCGTVSAQEVTVQLRFLFTRAFVGAGLGPGSEVQQAVQAALLLDAGVPLSAQATATQNIPGSSQAAAPESVDAAAQRFAAQPAAVRDAWLAAHLTAVRAGGLTLGQLP